MIKVPSVCPAKAVLSVQKAKRASVVVLVTRVKPVFVVNAVQWVSPVPRVFVVRLEWLAFLEPQASTVAQALMDLTVSPVPKASPVSPVHPVPWVDPVLMAYLALEEKWEATVSMEGLVQKAHVVLLAHPAELVPPESQECLEYQALWVHLDLLVHRVLVDQLVSRVQRAFEGSMV